MTAATDTTAIDGRAESRLVPYLLGSLASLAVIVLYAQWTIEPHIRYDDFAFLTRSRTWNDALANLWLPMNDHAMPLSRLLAGVLMAVVPGQSLIPRAAEVQGLLAVLVGMWLVYRFVRREFGHPWYGLVAMTLWGVTTAYYECVTWYSASFFLCSFDTTIAALLAAQSWRLTGRPWSLARCALFCALAPGWYAGGILAGGFAAVYLVWRDRDDPAVRSAGARVAACAAPILGTVLFLAVSLPRTADRIIHAEHYRGKTVFAAFDMRTGVENTLRTLADNQVLGAFGISHKLTVIPWPGVWAIVALEAAIALACWRLSSKRRAMVVGAAFILISDLLVYSARADWSYVRTVHNWTRYHLFPHFGVVLFAVVLLQQLDRRWLSLRESGSLSGLQIAGIVALIGASLAAHVPRSSQAHFYIPEQIQMLRRVERVDAACRNAGISAETARQALGMLQFPLSYDGDNAWEFLRGSRTPVDMSVDEARARLQAIR